MSAPAYARRVLRDLLLLVREIPIEFEARVHRLVMTLHRPHDLDTGEPWCLTHGWAKPRQWPCDEWIRADEARARVEERRKALRPSATA